MEWQRRPTDNHLWRWKGDGGTRAPSNAHRYTIIPAHRSNSCVSADCTLSLAHHHDSTGKKGNPDLARVWRNLGHNRPITSQRSQLMTLHEVRESSRKTSGAQLGKICYAISMFFATQKFITAFIRAQK
jgi:hypothetical protein